MNNLQDLIAQHKGDRSYSKLAAASGDLVKSATLQRIATIPTGAFPEPKALEGIATAFNIPISDVVLAAGRSAGLSTEPMPDVHQLREQIFYWQHHTLTYKTALGSLHARIIKAKP
ncbi:hypothetical protein CGQ24_07350 [Arthrobacter sp. 7749]|nr:hypothetical protein CGQ24_07350 [Arthrobacter sp. 7749]